MSKWLSDDVAREVARAEVEGDRGEDLLLILLLLRVVGGDGGGDGVDSGDLVEGS